MAAFPEQAWEELFREHGVREEEECSPSPKPDQYDANVMDELFQALEGDYAFHDTPPLESRPQPVRNRRDTAPAVLCTVSVGTQATPAKEKNVISGSFVDKVMAWASQGRDVLRVKLKATLAFHGLTLADDVVVPRRCLSFADPVDTFAPTRSSSQPKKVKLAPSDVNANICFSSTPQNVDIPVLKKLSTKSNQHCTTAESAAEDFFQAIRDEPCGPSAKILEKDPGAAYVRLQICPEAERLARKVDNPVQPRKAKEKCATVEAARRYNFAIENRCSYEGNPRTFCPFCKKDTENSNHFRSHAKILDEEKLHSYCKAVFF
ncbi:FAST kinase domain-containing protein 3, mitochondrial [Frankliniella fusca]|uniref:FAST kinase domain-containing protein 3, mitochondrial n=1 Tax=Frankliniella fusca TaxID=407009 RepID=A0AAE1H882_9NEOP|nr:FAST kinase domain-containing protein 3, mitochondrial [Frankliniella fusca]